MNQPKIFVQIAAYRDPELLPTIRDCLKKAKHPERLTFGICWQHDEQDSLAEFAKHPAFKVIDYHWADSKGLCWARSLIQELWAGEEFTLQLDSHHRFAKDWDEKLIEMMNQTGSSKPLIGSYAGRYTPTGNKILNVDPYAMVADDFTASGTILFRPHSIPNWVQLTGPVKARFVSGHFFFTLGIHCREYRYDPNLYFAGDEISLSIRSFTLGYDLYHPHRTLIWHEYTREGRTKHWTDHDAKLVQQKRTELTWHERDVLSKRRLRHMLQEEDNGIDLGVYGLGTVRSHRDYELYAGIDFKNRRLQQEAIDGVAPPCTYVDEATWEAGFVRHHQSRVIWGDRIPRGLDYQFWCFAIEDVAGNVIYRNDVTEDHNLFSATERTVYFASSHKPYKAVIWPFSKTRGWMTKVEIPL